MLLRLLMLVSPLVCDDGNNALDIAMEIYFQPGILLLDALPSVRDSRFAFPVGMAATVMAWLFAVALPALIAYLVRPRGREG